MELQQSRRGRGRLAHVPTDKDRQMVEVLAGFAIPQDKIGDVLDIDKKTLLKHYGRELRRGSAMVEAKLAGNLLRLAGGNDGTALKAIMFSLQCRFGWSQYAPAPVQPKPLGKKKEAEIAAHTAHEASGWAELLN
jgi:hypothetical protein